MEHKILDPEELEVREKDAPVGAIAGAAAGAVIGGAVGGPVGALVGALAGAPVGALAGNVGGALATGPADAEEIVAEAEAHREEIQDNSDQ